MATVQEVISRADSWVGHTEKYNNRTRFNDKFYGREVNGAAYPWCAAFTSVICEESGMRRNIDYPHSAGVAVCRNWAIQHGRWVAPSQIRKGDLVVFTFSHIAFARADAAGGAVKTIEGNTSAGTGGSQRDGGGVHRRTRPLSLVRGGIRLNYTSASAEASTPAEPEGVLGMSKRITTSRRKAQKATGTRHLQIDDKGNYSILVGPADFIVSAKADIKGLKAGEHGYLILAEVMYKKGQPTKISREIATVKVTANTTETVTGSYGLFKDYKGKSPRLRLIFKTSAKKATASNIVVSGLRD
ncbi:MULTISPECIES: hypothetical protein [unclassified Brevibacterium]|uniref:hypothetical protein n=1 Tax=unclassified Brevibacterium TaxID=2614124 RepID=UPI001E61C233|nr:MULTISPECIES: hypothetical protein [unclassified Brevibacterium]MCD1287159.1 hypothetical protein [Brevibacterium sp. CCUG 69071]MDK8436390.1 hypothetical protein [Brevibacterium sp. H-BE7]